MPAGVGKIILDASVERVVQAAKVGGNAIKKMVDQSSKLGEELGKTPGQLAKSLIGATAIVAAIRAASQAVDELNRKAAEAGRQRGTGVLARADAAGRLGITGADAEAVTAPGARSREERTSFLGALAAGGALDRQTVFEATEVFGGGFASEEETVQAARSGDIAGLRRRIAGRRAAFTPEALDELNVRAFENTLADQGQQVQAERSRRARAAEALRANFAARNPYTSLAVDAAGVIPGLNQEANAILLNRNTDVLKAIEANTKPRPSLAPAVGKN